MAKILVTHINPHLDDIAAIWLFKKFSPDWKNAKTRFISAEQGHSGLEDDENTLHIGVGRGKYDEHKGDVGESAMSLVWKDIKEKGLGPKDEFEEKALDEMTRWNTLIDTASLPIGEFDEYMVDGFIRSRKNDPVDSLKTIELGTEILERILPNIIKKQKGLVDWEKRIEFKSRWGKSVAVESDFVSQEFAYKDGYQVIIIKGPTRKFIGIFAPGTSDVDLTPVYLKITEIDPESGWYIHHAKKMILCGSSSAPNVKRSNLTLQQVIDVVKNA